MLVPHKGHHAPAISLLGTPRGACDTSAAEPAPWHECAVWGRELWQRRSEALGARRFTTQKPVGTSAQSVRPEPHPSAAASLSRGFRKASVSCRSLTCVRGLRAQRSRCGSASPYVVLGLVSGSRLKGGGFLVPCCPRLGRVPRRSARVFCLSSAFQWFWSHP
ncbi:hypothetical protein NDU88_002744 [Pleurodeles waltl]|uniref:Uncharacterized protein n=1 Tax=Pleurodeles waltl TaxID=8319 RepID=A0AAV7MPS4_PLEWA|nr:hypothetical protein NDU88_002744 [Pleurodeles waltl]